jgi:RNA polymerase sigma-B factor
VQIGVRGLIIATEKFQLDRGVAFSSFAIPYIRGAIQHHNRDSFGLVKIPRRSFEAVASVKKSQRRLAAMGRELPLEQVAEAHGMSREKWAWTIDAVARKPVVDIDELHHVAEEDADEDAVDRTELKARLLDALARLPRVKREIMIGLYLEQKTAAAVARKSGLSLPEVQQLEAETIEILRQQLGAVA